MKNIFTCLVTAAALIAGTPSAVHAADSPDAFLKLLGEAQTQSSQLSADWKSCARQPDIDWAGDVPEVALIKGEVTAVLHTAAALDVVRSQASPTQLAAMDRIVPVVREIGDNMTKAIDFLAKNQKRLTSKQYKDYLEQSSDTSGRLSTLVSQMVDYEGRKARFDLAKRNLELAAK